MANPAVACVSFSERDNIPTSELPGGAQIATQLDTESHWYATLLRRKKRHDTDIKVTAVLRDGRATRGGPVNGEGINRVSTCPNKPGLRSVDLKTDFYRAA